MKRLTRLLVFSVAFWIVVACGGRRPAEQTSTSSNPIRIPTVTPEPATATESPFVSHRTPIPTRTPRVDQDGSGSGPSQPSGTRPDAPGPVGLTGTDPEPEPVTYVAGGEPCPLLPMDFAGGGGSGQSYMGLGDINSPAVLATLSDHPGPIRWAAFSPDDNTIATLSEDSLYRWDGELLQPRGSLFLADDLGGDFSDPSLSADGRLLAARVDYDTRVWDLHTGSLLLDGLPARFALSPKGRFIATSEGDSSAILWDVASGQQLHRLEGSPGEGGLVYGGHVGPINGLAFSPNGRALATVSLDGTLRLWDVASGRQLRCFEVEPPPSFYRARELAFSPDGRRILNHDARSVQVWDALDGDLLHTFRQPAGLNHPEFFASASFGPGGQALLTANNDGTARIWQADSGRLLGLLAHDGSPSLAIFSPDGGRILTAVNSIGQDDTSIHASLWLWDAHHQDLKLAAEAENLVEEGIALALSGDAAAARRQFERAGALNPFPSYALDETAPARAAVALGARAIEDFKGRRPQAAMEKLSLAYTFDPEPSVTPRQWYDLCHYGGLLADPAAILPACDQAVRLRAIRDAYDARAIARALAGDLEGAAADFVISVEQANRWTPADEVNQRLAWIDILRGDGPAGRPVNPFGADELEALRSALWAELGQ